MRRMERAKSKVEAVAAAATPATAGAAGAAGAVDVGEPGTTRALIWRLQSGGWTQVEAGNLAAIALGLRPARTGWTGAELDHLRFLKSLVTTGRVEH